MVAYLYIYGYCYLYQTFLMNIEICINSDGYMYKKVYSYDTGAGSFLVWMSVWYVLQKQGSMLWHTKIWSWTHAHLFENSDF